MEGFYEIKKSVVNKATKTLVEKVIKLPYVVFSDNSEIDVVKLPFFNKVAEIDFTMSTPILTLFNKGFYKKAYEISEIYGKIFPDFMKIIEDYSRLRDIDSGLI